MSAAMVPLPEDPLWPPRELLLNIVWYTFVVPVIAAQELLEKIKEL